MNCIYLESVQSGLRIYGRCKIDNQICVLSRYCHILDRVVSADIYKKGGCVKENGLKWRFYEGVPKMSRP